jgi:hydroxymethylbilane synthase
VTAAHSSYRLRLGTRGSQLALWQARAVAGRLAESGGPEVEVVVIRTSGDRLQEAPLSEVGGKRLFVKEIEDALLKNEIDLAVHSSKDMPAVLVEGLEIAGVLPREDPLDAVILPVRADVSWQMAEGPFDDRRSAISHQPSAITTVDDLVKSLGPSPKVGTSSVRRVAQLTRLLPNAEFLPIRGNLDTRLRKLDEANYDALVLAAAGLRRLGFASRISLRLPPTACVPAPGQGIVAVEMRTGDEVVRQAVARIDDPVSRAALEAERAVVEALGGGCQTPVGAFARALDEESFELTAAVIALDGSRVVRGASRGPWRDAAAIGARVGGQLIADGAGEILADARRAQGAVEGIQP